MAGGAFRGAPRRRPAALPGGPVGRIARSTIDEVQERLDAVAVVEGYVRLERRGGRYWARCPFHSGGQERTPSFTVDPDRKMYHCFGCGKGGGIIGFVMEMDKTGFPEAVEGLARRLGVEIAYEGGPLPDAALRDAEHARREQLFELNRRVAGTFSHFLLEKPEGRPALDYILSRGADMGAVRRFRLGYAPRDRGWLRRFLEGKGYSGEFLDGSGLFSRGSPGMAFFSGRLMFPIADRQGRTVAFGGRALPGAAWAGGGEPPKYINSRETGAYKKGQILFGLDLALPEIRRSKRVYVAEGYMDVMALHQAGIANAVAPCGTSFTDEQARLLRNWADSAALVFDSDEAGLKAADKAIVTCRRNGLACSLSVPGMGGGGRDAGRGAASDAGAEMKDPADILLKFGAEALKGAMENGMLDFEYLIARGKTLYDTSMPQGKAGALAALYPYLDALGSQTERDACIEAAADALRADRAAARADYARRRAGGGSHGGAGSGAIGGGGGERDSGGQAGGREGPMRMNDELFLLTLVAVTPGLYPDFRASVGMREIEDPAAKELFVALEECFMNGESGADALFARIAWDGLRGFVAERGSSPEFGAGDPAKLVRDGIKRVRLKKLRRRLSEIEGDLRFRERGGAAGPAADGDAAALEDLIAEKMGLDAEIRELEYADGKVSKQ